MRNTVAAIAAVCIVLLMSAFVGSRLQRNTVRMSSEAERVGVTKNAVLQAEPKIALDSYAPAPTPASTPYAIAAPQIARTGKISLLVNDVERTVAAVSRVARERGGDVFSLHVDNADAQTAASAQMEIRVLAGLFDTVLTEIGKAGKVRERSIGAQDLIGDITDSSARLRNLRRTESDIRAIMDRSGTVTQVLDAENQLSQVREQIETLQSGLKSMRGRVAYSTLDVSIAAEAAGVPVEPSAASQLSGAWRAALHSTAQTTVGFIALLMWLLVYAPYLLLSTLVVYIAYAQVRKRLRGATMAQ